MVLDLLVEQVVELAEHEGADGAVVLPVGQVRPFPQDAPDLEALPVGLAVGDEPHHRGGGADQQQHRDEGDPAIAAAHRLRAYRSPGVALISGQASGGYRGASSLPVSIALDARAHSRLTLPTSRDRVETEATASFLLDGNRVRRLSAVAAHSHASRR